jgi:hypothetical protein
MEKVVIQAIDCYRHDYWKVSLDLLSKINILDAISEYSYLGNGTEPLNEEGYAYLEIDSDCGIFDKAMKFYGKKYELDFDTLQYEFDENFDDYRDWLDQLDSYDTDLIDEKGFTVDNVPEDLSAVLMADKDEEESDEDDD